MPWANAIRVGTLLLLMKYWLLLISLLFCLTHAHAQLVITKIPAQTTWVEENAFKDRKGGVEAVCHVISADGDSWRLESADTEANIIISTCSGGRVTSTQKPTPPASPAPTVAMEELLSVLKSRAIYETVDIIGGIGYSRFKQTGPNGFVRTIWVDRSNGFPHRSVIDYGDGTSREQRFRKLSVDPNTQSRLFTPNTLFPFFGQYLDEWHARLTK